ncbi:hypothetical protein A5M85_09010 [Cellulophaga lytica]|nr:hypothetical protein A5M85_09010 [Cellulophaga lytica]
MNINKLLITSLLLTFTVGLMVFIKLSYYFWSTQFDALIYLAIILVLIAVLSALIAFVQSSIQFYTTQKFEWNWLFSFILVCLYAIGFTYYLIFS